MFIEKETVDNFALVKTAVNLTASVIIERTGGIPPPLSLSKIANYAIEIGLKLCDLLRYIKRSCDNYNKVKIIIRK